MEEEWNKMPEKFILKACKSFRRRVDIIIEKKITAAILSKFTVLCLSSYFVTYFLELKLILFYNWVYYYYRIFIILLLHPIYIYIYIYIKNIPNFTFGLCTKDSGPFAVRRIKSSVCPNIYHSDKKWLHVFPLLGFLFPFGKTFCIKTVSKIH